MLPWPAPELRYRNGVRHVGTSWEDKGDPLVNTFFRPSRYRLGAAVGAWIFAVLASATPAFADVSAVSGGAFGESINVTRTGETQQVSGPTPQVLLPSNGGGPFTNSLTTTSVGHVATVGRMDVSTQGSLGATGSAASSASITNLSAFDGLVTIQSLSSRCESDSNGSTGSSTISGLVINGKAVNPGAGANTILYQNHGFKVLFNEQSKSDKPNFADITVNAIHVSLTTPAGTGHLILSQSRCHDEGPPVIIPQVPQALLAPLSLTLLVGGAVVLAWRRNDLVQPRG
jgi:hypothetical protein